MPAKKPQPVSRRPQQKKKQSCELLIGKYKPAVVKASRDFVGEAGSTSQAGIDSCSDMIGGITNITYICKLSVFKKHHAAVGLIIVRSIQFLVLLRNKCSAPS